ncbi:Clan CE, family C48, Ulp1-like cysteine peptidase [Trichomonas vaginalis G3]|uniref:Clan CE, family C48, Ulp1-like cysteine peptidase n=1 Tax=Trichomonas vaginalis (strain ATCC PRA-98 / G3) TaxID=412133 RepID=A2E115_TRIV3|nr:protein desumoylation [Trichomonas vaginalis G3]EAY13647.1 Clan CE, family C48, Ulp1-like cysteine peptidase [Trichomonas vaginalis G3]KAI5529921.1 protein desumoylation [Trichomonas vaginalis G3]|eukprot:XP_001325870.1 Clan CE, family C48, Ulp1-like cysteine peptidase [Trichomonas vaginalis G3]
MTKISPLLPVILGENHCIEDFFKPNKAVKSDKPSNLQQNENSNQVQQSLKQIQLKYTDLFCLEKHEWISDIVIDAYLKIVVNKSPFDIGATNTYFGQYLDVENHEKMRQWEGIKPLLEGKFTQFLIPYRTNSHWILFDVAWDDNTITLYDSLNRPTPSAAKKLKNFLTKNSDKEWKFNKPIVSGQENSNDCGVFLIKFSEYISNGDDPLDVDQKVARKARKEIKEVLMQHITDYRLNPPNRKSNQTIK